MFAFTDQRGALVVSAMFWLLIEPIAVEGDLA